MSIPNHVHIVISKIIVNANKNKKTTTSCEMVAFLLGTTHERIR